MFSILTALVTHQLYMLPVSSPLYFDFFQMYLYKEAISLEMYILAPVTKTHGPLLRDFFPNGIPKLDTKLKYLCTLQMNV